MNRVNQVAIDPRAALRQEEVPSEGCALSETALHVIRAVGLLLLAASVGCFIASLHIPAIALLVASVAIVLLGVALKKGEPAVIESMDPSEVAKIEEFADYLASQYNEERLDFLVNGESYTFAEMESEYIIAPLEDWEEGNGAGIFISKEAEPFRSDYEPEMVFRCLAGVTCALINKHARDRAVEIFSAPPYGFSNFYKALQRFANTGDLDSTFRTRADGHIHNVVRDTFRSALDPNGAIEQTILAIENDPNALAEYKDVAECIQFSFSIVQLILLRDRGAN